MRLKCMQVLSQAQNGRQRLATVAAVVFLQSAPAAFDERRRQQQQQWAETLYSSRRANCCCHSGTSAATAQQQQQQQLSCHTARYNSTGKGHFTWRSINSPQHTTAAADAPTAPPSAYQATG
jgi:hypothetical protein